MKKYTVERELPDLYGVGTKLHQTRHTLESVIMEIDSSLDSVKNITTEDRNRVNSKVSCLWVVLNSLENINEMVEALDSQAAQENHLAAVKEALLTPEDQRDYLQRKTITDKGLSADGISPEEAYEQYAEEVSSSPAEPIVLD